MPREGPLLLVSNHPGLAVAVALFAATPRNDLRVIAAERPFLDALPNTSRHLLTVAETSAGRPGVARAAASHLRRDREWLTATFQLLIRALRNVDARVEFGHPMHAKAVAAIGDDRGDAAVDGE